jgi:hypothetical protein
MTLYNRRKAEENKRLMSGINNAKEIERALNIKFAGEI